MNDLEWVLLISDHYDESRIFYHTTLELPIVREIPEEHFIQFQMKNCYLAIYGRKEIETLLGKPVMGTGGGAIYSFAHVDDVDDVYRKLKEKGVQFVKEPKTQPWGQKTAYFTDPDGHIWEIQKWEK